MKTFNIGDRVKIPLTKEGKELGDHNGTYDKFLEEASKHECCQLGYVYITWFGGGSVYLGFSPKDRFEYGAFLLSELEPYTDNLEPINNYNLI
jgi:hypothetical protein